MTSKFVVRTFDDESAPVIVQGVTGDTVVLSQGADDGRSWSGDRIAIAIDRVPELIAALRAVCSDRLTVTEGGG